MATRNPANKNQLSLVVYPISYKVLDIPGGFLAGFLVAINSSLWGVLRPIPPQDGIARDHQDIYVYIFTWGQQTTEIHPERETKRKRTCWLFVLPLGNSKQLGDPTSRGDYLHHSPQHTTTTFKGLEVFCGRTVDGLEFRCHSLLGCFFFKQVATVAGHVSRDLPL